MIIDSRTKVLFNRMLDKDYDNGDDFLHYDRDVIMSETFELGEFDAYRITYTLLGSSSLQSSEYVKKLMDNDEYKMFIVGEDVKTLLLNTKHSNVSQELHMPFDSMFVDVILTDDEYKLFGLALSFADKDKQSKVVDMIKGIVPSHPVKKYNKDSVTCMYYAYCDYCNDFRSFEFAFDIRTGITLDNKVVIEHYKKTEHEYYKVREKMKKVVVPFVHNLILFLNEPRVVTYVIQSNNAKRVKRGKIPIPSLLRTEIEIGLQQHIEKIYFNGLSSNKLDYSFWVRGHWRILNSPRYVNKKGQKIWILPHIRGSGILAPQVFDVVKAK